MLRACHLGFVILIIKSNFDIWNSCFLEPHWLHWRNPSFARFATTKRTAPNKQKHILFGLDQSKWTIGLSRCEYTLTDKYHCIIIHYSLVKSTKNVNAVIVYWPVLTLLWNSFITHLWPLGSPRFWLRRHSIEGQKPQVSSFDFWKWTKWVLNNEDGKQIKEKLLFSCELFL